MANLVLSKEISDFVENRLIFISGSARSGTSLLGSIVHSFSNIEYAYEPPLLFSLFPLLDNLEIEEWKILFETYVYEELLIGQLSGRSCNANLKDYSSFISSKGLEEYENRISKSLTKSEAIQIAKTKYLAIKCPDLNLFIPRLRELYPNIKIIHSVRSPLGTIESLVKKQWFEDENLMNNWLIWPMRKSLNNSLVPFWVPTDSEKEWLNSSVEHRASMYYSWMTDFHSVVNNKVLLLNYDEFVRNTDQSVKVISEYLGVGATRLTNEIIARIHTNSIDKDPSDKSTLSSASYSNLLKIYEKVLFKFR